jgi:hypothetical protein
MSLRASLQAPDPRTSSATPVRVSRIRARVPAAFIAFSHIAWDGHDLVVISKYDVILD